MILVFLFSLLASAIAETTTVVDVSSTNIETLKKAHPLFLVEFAAEHQAGLIYTFESIREQNGLQGVGLGVWNTNKDSSNLAAMEVHATPVLKLFKGGRIYHCPTEMSRLVIFLKRHQEQSPVVLSSQSELDAAVTHADVLVTAFMENNDSDMPVSLFKKLADEQRAAFRFALATFDSSEYKKPSVVILHKDSTKGEVYSGSWSEGELHKWLQQKAVPYFVSFSNFFDLAEHASIDHPIAYLIADSAHPSTPNLIEKFRSMAVDSREHVYLAHIDPTLLPTQARALTKLAASKNPSLRSQVDEHSPHGVVVVRHGNTRGGGVDLHIINENDAAATLRNQIVGQVTGKPVEKEPVQEKSFLDRLLNK